MRRTTAFRVWGRNSSSKKTTATKGHLKKVSSRCFKTFSPSFHLVQFVKCWQVFVELNSKRLPEVRENKKSRCLVFTSSTKLWREIRYFHVVVMHILGDLRAVSRIGGKGARRKIGCLNSDVFELRMSTGTGLFALLAVILKNFFGKSSL